MTVQYRYINGSWKIVVRPWEDWHGLDYRTESYWIVPGTVVNDQFNVVRGGVRGLQSWLAQ